MTLFCKKLDIANYSEDNSPFSCNEAIVSVIAQFENSNILFKANPNKFHLILNTHDLKYFIKIQISKYLVVSVKPSWYQIDCSSSFTEDVGELCNKARQKLHALSRVVKCMNIEKQRIIMRRKKVNSQLACPLIWMIHSRTLNKRINKIHEKAMRLVYDDNVSSFDELRNKDNSFNLQKEHPDPWHELYKAVNKLSPTLMTYVRFPT